MIRHATIHDVPRIGEIVNEHASLGKMLFKSYAQLYEALRDFAVYEIDGEVVGCVGLAIIWADMTEISLAGRQRRLSRPRPGSAAGGMVRRGSQAIADPPDHVADIRAIVF